MKIIISEEQLRLLISESYDSDRLNFLLDKINAMGINSLTDQEKETLSNISQGKEEPESDEQSPDPHYEPRDDEDSYAMHDEPPFDKAISPEYMDRVDNTNDKFKEDINLLGMFMYFSPEYEELDLGGEIWHVETVQDDSEPHLHVATAERDFYITPFWSGKDSVTIEFNDGRMKKYKINNVPENEKEMKNFVRTFYRYILPKIITKEID